MSDNLFRARVEPHRAPAQVDLLTDERDETAGEVLEDLMASSFPPAVPLYRPAERPLQAAAVSLHPTEPPVPVHRRSRKPWLIAGAVVVAAAGVGTRLATLDASPSPHTHAALLGQPVATSSPATSPSVPPASPTLKSGAIGDAASAPSVAVLAADWIAVHVGPGHVVACDVTVYALLRGRGFPAASLIRVQSGLADVELADVVAVSDVMRRQLGSSLASVTAAESLAVLADGSSTVQITPVALGGPGVYASRLAADRDARKAAGAALLHNAHLTVGGAAAAALSGGLVDTRVCMLLAVLAGSDKITVAAFTGPGPGAGPDIPFAGVVVSTFDGADAAVESARTTALTTMVKAQRPPYSPLSTTRVATGADQGLAILFSQPGTLGLLNSPTS